jgi:hypothetical protein
MSSNYIKSSTPEPNSIWLWVSSILFYIFEYNYEFKFILYLEYCGRDVCDLYDHIQKRNHGNGLKESEAKHIFRQVFKVLKIKLIQDLIRAKIIC